MLITTSPKRFNQWAALTQLLHEAFRYMEGRIDPPSSLESMGIEAFKKKAQDEVLIVAHDDDGKLVGCAFAALRDDCVYLSKVAVALTSRRQGITRSMFKAADEIARQHGKPFLELQTRVELIENHVTFGALGFVRVAETAHPGYSRATSITMRRRVGA
ncbi:MAG: GNAT family N-acetyltransferase [Betaproteobacteria bacterium]|jgi:predicted GNAT superfamily acetyltransferase|nr:GNAT family N-acetyltransferase [Betaproteobacteria bacterium]NCW26208.1 GNAT family N-acetyltransferase [Betaproteobacteria bacterium]NCW81800.1 GNAT family N-acetyltransferase [Betaproteobacteria bacterium]NDG58354.1 GNAT family N-acetyltransferase [Betaproteobacteria bacterium]